MPSSTPGVRQGYASGKVRREGKVREFRRENASTGPGSSHKSVHEECTFMYLGLRFTAT